MSNTKGIVIGSVIGAFAIYGAITACGKVSGNVDPDGMIGDAIADGARDSAAETATFPAGTVVAFAGQTPPAGWLLCDGSAVSRSEYSELFTSIGTLYGSGDDIRTFNVPDLRGRAVVGSGKGEGLTERRLAEQVGAETKSLTVDELPRHDHQLLIHEPAPQPNAGYWSLSWLSVPGFGAGQPPQGLLGGGVISFMTMRPAGSSAPFAITPPSVVLNYLIKI